MSLLTRLGKLLHRGRVEREMDEEIAFHLHARTEALIAEGLAPAEATRRARIEFGGAATHKDGMRAAWGMCSVSRLGSPSRPVCSSDYCQHGGRRGVRYTAA